jgi:cell fate (sporulation/competence/biofilm development) regulator YmcA (YheA/YmcA/DUF963 family)
MSLVLNVEILGEFKKLTAATQGANKQLSGLQGTASKISSGIGKAFATIGVGLSFAVITRELKEAAKAAVQDAKSQGLLANQLINTTNATDEQITAVEQQINKLSLTASIADDELRPAYATLLRTTRSTTKAIDLLTLASDVSAGSGKGLTSVTMALSKAYQGKFAALTKLGIPMSDSIQNASDYAKEMTKLNKLQSEAANTVGPELEEALAKVAEQQDLVNRISAAGIDWQKDLADAFAGSADKAANLDPYQRLNVALGEISESIGTLVVPLVEAFAKAIVDILPKIQNFFSTLNTALNSPLVQKAFVSLNKSFGDLGVSLGKLFGITAGPEAQGFVAFFVVLSGILEAIVKTVDLMVQGFKNAFPVFRIFSDLVNGIANALVSISGYEAPIIPGQISTPNSNSSRSTNNNVTINVNKGNVTAKEIAKAVNKNTKTTGAPSIASNAVRPV